MNLRAHKEPGRGNLDAALVRYDISFDELWRGYLSIGGDASKNEVAQYLNGLCSLPELQRKMLQWALNELKPDSKPQSEGSGKP